VNYYRPSEGLQAEHLYDEEFVVCAAASHRLAGQKNVELADLGQERWALSEPTLISQRWLLDRFREAGLPPPRVAFETRSLALKQRMVAASDLLTFTSRSAVRQFSGDSSAIILGEKKISWRFPVSVAYRKAAILPPVLRRFIAIIRSAAAS